MRTTKKGTRQYQNKGPIPGMYAWRWESTAAKCIGFGRLQVPDHGRVSAVEYRGDHDWINWLDDVRYQRCQRCGTIRSRY